MATDSIDGIMGRCVQEQARWLAAMRFALRTFDECWDYCEGQGMADARGSEQYERVLLEWVNAQFPQDVESFINDRCCVMDREQTRRVPGRVEPQPDEVSRR